MFTIVIGGKAMKYLSKILSIFILFFFSNQATAISFDHTIFDTLLQKNVENGVVNYKALKADKSELAYYLRQIEQVDPIEFKNWSQAEQMAFWINAYNAITIEAILQHYPIQWGSLISRARFPKNSIRQINKVWDTVFIKVMGKELTLNQIEHDILRKQFSDPLIHFVIVCASIGCPKLESRAFYANDLHQRLEQATQNFISDSKHVKLNKNENTIYLSSIFEWYKEDFKIQSETKGQFTKYKKSERGVMEFIVYRLSQEDRQFVLENQPKIRYLKYNWTLNEQK
jgi:hypothetical protein